MSNRDYVIVDKIKWWINSVGSGSRFPVPLCPKHNMRLEAVTSMIKIGATTKFRGDESEANVLRCAEGSHNFAIPRQLAQERIYVINKIDSSFFKDQKFINLDDEAIPVAESKVNDPNQKFFVTSRLMESKRGLQLVVYAGERGKTEKSQIFVEPEVKRLAFDQTNLHPNEVFLEVKATFSDGSTHTIKKGSGKK